MWWSDNEGGGRIQQFVLFVVVKTGLINESSQDSRWVELIWVIGGPVYMKHLRLSRLRALELRSRLLTWFSWNSLTSADGATSFSRMLPFTMVHLGWMSWFEHLFDYYSGPSFPLSLLDGCTSWPDCTEPSSQINGITSSRTLRTFRR